MGLRTAARTAKAAAGQDCRMSTEHRVDAADFRRALALIQHGERGDQAGMRVIVDDEVIPADRLPQLIRATVSILWQLVAQLCEPEEVAEIGETLTLASDPNQVDLDRDNRLVARMAMAQHSGDPSAEYDVLHDAATEPEGLLHLALTAAGVVSAMLPQLRTDPGRQLLNNLAMQALREENS
jgi:FAD/FMN-containing dehydrogenase